MPLSTQLSRLKKIINTDTFGSLNESMDILKSDLSKLFSSYFEYDDKDFIFNIAPNENGDLTVSVVANVKRVKPIKVMKL